jgi:hypothetical protein
VPDREETFIMPTPTLPTVHPQPRLALATAMLVLLAACGGGGGSGDSAAPPAGRAGALSAAGPGELATWAQDRLRALDAQGRLAGNGVLVGLAPPTAMPIAGAAPGSPSTSADIPATSRTLVQEEGVDEADLLINHGATLLALARSSEGGSGGVQLVAQARRSDGTLATPATLQLERDGGSLQPEGLVLGDEGRALVALARRWERAPAGEVCETCLTIAPVWLKSGIQVQRIDTRDAARPAAGTRLAIEGELIDSRKVGDTLVLVAVHRPALEVQALPASAAPAAKAAAIAAVTSTKLIPTLRRDGGAPEPLFRDTDCWLARDNGSLAVQLTTITLIDLKSPTLAQSTRCFAGGTEAVYLTPRNLWLATTRFTPLNESRSASAPAQYRTDVHQLALDLSGTGGLAWRGSADVAGHLGWDTPRKSYRFSEHEGHLRVLTFTGEMGWAVLEDANSKPASPAQLTVLRADSATTSADGRTLATVATLPNSRRPAAIGKPGEQVFAVRFAGNRGYVVTFRRVDPLYVLELADVADPRVAGEVELPGFSQMLVPLDGGLLLGLGRDADAAGVAMGLQFVLFDVSNAASPRVLSTVRAGSTGSFSALESSRHGLALRQDGNTVRLALPVMLSGRPWTDWQRGVQTLEIDTTARTLAARSLLGAVGGSSFVSLLGEERALLVGEQVLHLRDGAISAYGW